MDERSDDIKHARNVMNFTGVSNDPVWDEDEPLQYEEWGALHPDYGKSGIQRARWTDSEIMHIGRTCEELLKSSSNNVVSRCLKCIKSDPAARAIFHEIHVLDSARLRTGYLVYLKKQA